MYTLTPGRRELNWYMDTCKGWGEQIDFEQSGGKQSITKNKQGASVAHNHQG